MNGYIRRELTPQLANLERQAKQGLISQRVYLAAFQLFAYPERRQLQCQHMSDDTMLELKKLGVL